MVYLIFWFPLRKRLRIATVAFLAAMSSSRSDVVTQCVRSSVINEGVLIKPKKAKKFQGCFEEVSRVFRGSFKGVSRKFQRCSKKVSSVFQESFKGDSRKFHESFKELSRVFQGTFKDFSRKF